MFWGVTLVVTLLCVSGFIYEQISRKSAEKHLSPKGRFADLGSHRLHYVKVGLAKPTVVFESAFDPAGNLQWLNIQQALKTNATTISYDRAGLMRSERGSNPKSNEAMTKELYQLI